MILLMMAVFGFRLQAAELAAAGGNAWKAVWVERTPAGAAKLMGLESGAAGGPRVILEISPELPDISRPLLTGDGEAVIFTNRQASLVPESAVDPAILSETEAVPQVQRIAWQGGPVQSLGRGMAVDLWRDPETKAEMVCALETLLPEGRGAASGETLVRFAVDQPETREIIWTETPVAVDNFQLSADGTRAAGLFPWPQAGLADMTAHKITPLAHGVWPSLTPDDSYAAWVLDGTRRRLRVFAPNLDPGWELNFTEQTALEGRGLFHPRWSNDPQMIVFTALDTAGGESETRTGDVFAARLRADLRRVESVEPLTAGAQASAPDLWIAGGETRVSSLPQRPVVVPKETPKPWPVTLDGAVFAWENARTAPPAGPVTGPLTPRKFAVHGRHFEMNLSEGAFEAPPAAAERLARECATSSAWSMECLLTERRTDPPLSVQLAALELPDGRAAFALYRVDRKLVLRVLLGGLAERPVGVYPVVLTHLAIEDDRPVHLLLSLKGDRLGCYVDGQLMKEFQLENAGLAGWSAAEAPADPSQAQVPAGAPGRLVFGDLQPYGASWTGALERVAFYSRALGADEIREAWTSAQRLMEKRKRPSRIRLKAKLLQAPPVSAAAPEKSQKPQALAASVWEVEQVSSGVMEHRKIAVLHWTRLAGQPVPVSLPEAGGSMDLILETLEEHPELADSPEIDRQLPETEIPLYFNSAPPGRQPASPGGTGYQVR